MTSLLTTSAASFSKAAGYDLDTYEKEEGDIDGPFALAVSIDCGNGGQIIWSVSYTHLDVYKRQVHHGPGKTGGPVGLDQ